MQVLRPPRHSESETQHRAQRALNASQVTPMPDRTTALCIRGGLAPRSEASLGSQPLLPQMLRLKQ